MSSLFSNLWHLGSPFALTPPHEADDPVLQLKRQILNEIDNHGYKVPRGNTDTKVQYADYTFVSIATIDRIFNTNNSRNLRRSLEKNLNSFSPSNGTRAPDVNKLIEHVKNKAMKLYTILLLIDQSNHVVELFDSHPHIDDRIFEQFTWTENREMGPYCTMQYLKGSPLKDYAGPFYTKQWLIPPVLIPARHWEYPAKDYRFPFVSYPKRLETENSFGIISIVEIADGHLESPKYEPGSLVIHKAVRKEERVSWRKLEKEVVTLRARQADNVVPLLASFTAGSHEPCTAGYVEESLHMLFPYAESGDMKAWLQNPSPPPELSDSTAREKYVFAAMESIALGVTHIHRENNGRICVHHDLKPANIALFRDKNETGGYQHIWKIIDFGTANLKDPNEGTGTSNPKIGTEAYRPPEFYRGANAGNLEKHGRAFDIWSLGCIFLELATVCKYGWSDDGLSAFKRLRENNTVHDNGGKEPCDNSFHNNTNAVHSWISRLELQSSQNLCTVLQLIKSMLLGRNQRTFAWEVYMDLYYMLHPNEDEEVLAKLLRRFVQPSREPITQLDNQHNPLQRAISNGRPKWWKDILKENHWSVDQSTSTLELAWQTRQVVSHHSTLEFVEKTHDFRVNKLFGRHAIDSQIGAAFGGSNCVGLHGISGVGKSHIAYHYIVRHRDTDVTKERKHTFWIEAGSNYTFLESFRRIAEKLKFSHDDDEDGLMRSVRTWLEDRENGPWIMIIDGLDRNETAIRLKNELPQDCGQILVTTKNRVVLEHFWLPNSKNVRIPVDGLDLDDCRSVFRWHMQDELIVEDNTYMDVLLRSLSLPRSIVLLAKHLTRFNIPALTMYEHLQKGNPYIVRNALSEFYLGLFEPVASSTVDSSDRQKSFAEWPTEELKLLGVLSCLNLTEIERDLVERGYEDHPMLAEMLGTLENHSFIAKKNRKQYYMREIISKAVQEWTKKYMAPCALVELHDAALTMVFRHYYQRSQPGSKYLRKTKYMSHFDRFLDFSKDYTDKSSCDISDNMATAVNSFSRVYLDDGRYDDAICVLEFTHRRYKGKNCSYQLGRALAKTYILCSQGQPSNLATTNIKNAQILLDEMIKISAREKTSEQRLWLTIDLADLHSQSNRPETALEVLAELHDFRLNTKDTLARIAKITGVKQRTAQRLAISREIEEAKAQCRMAKMDTTPNKEQKIKTAQYGLYRARSAIGKWFNREIEWLAFVNESIADVLSESNDESKLDEAERLLTSRLHDIEAETRAASHSWSSKGIWDIKCKIALVWVRKGLFQKGIASLEELLKNYEGQYGRNDRLTRNCAHLLKYAYQKDGRFADAEQYEKNLGLEKSERKL